MAAAGEQLLVAPAPKWGRRLPELRWAASPNHSARPSWHPRPSLIVCHTPQAPYESAVRFCRDSSSDVSYHSITREDGREATQLVPWSRKAWHALDENGGSEGHAIAGYAAKIDPRSEGCRRWARLVAYRLHANGLPAKWTRGKRGARGFCRHADLQSDRSDPIPSVARWLVFVYLVKREYRRGGFPDSYGVS